MGNKLDFILPKINKGSNSDIFLCNKKKYLNQCKLCDFQPIKLPIALKKSIKLELFNNEVNALLSLQGIKGVINIIGFHKSKKYILMELCKKDLFNWLIDENNIITEDLFFIILKQIVNIIYKCHLKNIIHRDIKLENIGLCPDIYNLRLLDFDRSVILNKKKYDCKNLFGSKCNTPPEVLKNTSLTDIKSIDYWQVGILGYILIVKKYPFLSSKHIIKKKHKWPKWIKINSLKIKYIIDGLLIKEPNLRFGIKELQELLQT